MEEARCYVTPLPGLVTIDIVVLWNSLLCIHTMPELIAIETVLMDI